MPALTRVSSLVLASAVAATTVWACQSGSPPPVAPAPKTQAQALERIAQACTKISSCAHPHDAARERDPSACFDWWLGHVEGEARDFGECILHAKDCTALDACSRERGDPVAASYCRSHPSTQTACQGQKLITCSEDDPAESRAVDCDTIGARCGEQNGAGGLIARACLSPTACPANAPDARCDGKRAVVSCHEGALERINCPADAPCEEHRGTGGEQFAMCERPGHAHCEQVGQRRCDGSLLLQCLPHGPLGEPKMLNCAHLGLVCAEPTKGKAACVVAQPPKTESCEPGARCDGEALTFCAAGVRVKVSCASVGFRHCDPDGHGLEASCGTAGPP